MGAGWGRREMHTTDHADLRPNSRRGLRERRKAMEQPVFPAHARTGDPNSPLEAYPLIRSHARSYP